MMEYSKRERCPFQLRRIGSPATCKGIADSFRLHQGKTLIGRHLAVVDIYLNSSVHKQLISRQHAELWMDWHHNTQVVYLLDKSTNGTFVNDIKIHGKVRLEEGDTLTFGHTQGVRIQPGMLRSQLQSEFRFVLEKVLSENTPPHDDKIVPTCTDTRLSSLPWHPVINRSHQSEQPITSHQGNASPTVPSNKNYTLDYRQNNKSEPIIHDESLEVRTSQVGSLDRETNFTSHKQKDYVKQHIDDLPCSHSTNRLLTVCQSHPTTCPVDLRILKTCYSKDDEDATTHVSAKAVATHGDQDNSSADQQPATCTSVSSHPHERAIPCTQIKDTETDDDLLELTSIISAKASQFDQSESESDSERNLTGMSPVFHITKGSWLPSKCTTPKKSQPACVSVQDRVVLSSSSSSSSSSPVKSESCPVRGSSSLVLSNVHSQPFIDSNMSTQTSSQADYLPCTLSASSSATPQLFTKRTTDEPKCRKRGHTSTSKKKTKHKRGFPRPNNKSESSSGVAVDSTQPVEAEVCDSYDCCRPTDNTLDWVQCDDCDKWYHVACAGCDYDTVRKDSAAFHCGCT